MTRIALSPLRPAYDSQKPSDDLQRAQDCPSTKERFSEEQTLGIESDKDQENCGAIVRKGQQWKVLLATSLQSFWVVGLAQSFGIWQRHYGSDKAVDSGILQPGDMTKRATIATMGSLGNGGIIAAFGIFYYPYLTRIGKHVKSVCLLGTFLSSLGFAISVGSNQLAVLVIGQGLLVGIGSGILLYTLSPILPEYFGQRSGLAQGVQMAAASAGGACLSMVTPELLNAVGTQKTLGIFSGMSVVLGICVSILAQPPRKFEKRSEHVVSWRDFKKPVFTLLMLANLLGPLTIAIPMTFGPEFSESLRFSDKNGSVLLAINGAVGCAARLANGYVSDKVGHLNMLTLATALYAVGAWGLWLTAAQVGNGTLWISFVVLHGLVNGTFNTLINSIQRRLFGPELYFSYSGAMTSVRGVGNVVGVPIAGVLVTRIKDVELRGVDFTEPIIYTGVVLLLSTLTLAGIRVMDARKNGWMWKR